MDLQESLTQKEKIRILCDYFKYKLSRVKN